MVDRYRNGGAGVANGGSAGSSDGTVRGRPSWGASGRRDVASVGGSGGADRGRDGVSNGGASNGGASSGGALGRPDVGRGAGTPRVGNGKPSARAKALGDLTRLDGRDPAAGARIRGAGDGLDTGRRAGLAAAARVVGGGGVRPSDFGGSGYRDGHYGGHHDGHHDHHGYDSCWPWGFGYHNGHFSVSFGWNWWWGDCWWYWPSYYSCYYPYWYYYYRPYYYGYGYYPATYSTIVYRTVYEEPETVYVTVPAERGEAVAEPSGPSNPVPRAASSLSIAAERYLTLGDAAFREGRWSDAVQLYARAVELAPDQGALYLVLADALFAAGDYHYAAFAVRKALELEPVLIQEPVDKHRFYGDPADFDRQLATLELYLESHPTDRDARLVLATNFLFGARPAAAVDLFDANKAPASAAALDDAANRVLESARIHQFGPPAGAPEGEKP